MEMRPYKILVVGAGITGALSSNLIRQTLKGNATIEVWEKSRGVGGRMNSSRMNSDSKLSCDMGAQYITATKDYMYKHQRYHVIYQNNRMISCFF